MFQSTNITISTDQILEASNHKISIWELNGNCILANSEFKKWAKKKISTSISEDSIQTVNINHHHIPRFFSDQKLTDYEMQVGKQRFKISQKKILSDSGVNYIFIQVEDYCVSKEEPFKLNVRESWKNVIDGLPDAFVIVNSQGLIHYQNDRAREIFGYRNNELIGESLNVLFSEGYHDFIKDVHLKSNFYSENPEDTLILALKKGNIEFRVSVLANSIKIQNDQFMILSFTDFSKQIQKQNEILKVKNELLSKIDKFENILDSISECFCTVDSQWKLQYWNRAAVKSTRRTKQQVIGHDIWDIFPQSENSLLKSYCNQVMKTRKSAMFEHKSDYGKWFYNSVHPNENGGITIYFKDITQRKLREIELIELKNNLFAAINATDDLIWAVNSQYSLITANENFRNLSNREMSNGLNGIGFFSSNGKKVNEQFEKLYDKCMTGNVFSISIDILPNYLMRFHPVYGASGLVVGAACHAVDTSLIDELKNQNVANSEKFKALVQNGSDLIFIVNHHDQISYTSKSISKYFNFEIDCSFQEFQSLVHPADINILKESLLQIGEKSNIRIPAFRIKSSTGEYIWLEAVVDNLLNNAHVMGLVFNARDISFFKAKEIELENLIRELMQSNADLMQFSFITSHNLRSPLSNINGLLKFLDRESMSVESNQVISMIDKAANKLSDTITDLSKILVIKNNSNITRENIDIDKCFNYVNRTFLDTQKSINAEVVFNFKVKYVSFNPVYLESIFVNLISNAIKYRHPKRNLTISISTEAVSNGVEIKIKDNGLGINLERHGERIFGLYQRFHANIEGQGLGLFIVKAQIEALGGTISLESEEGEGSLFTIFVPNDPI